MKLNNNAKLILGISVAAGLAIAISMILSAERSKDFRRKISSSLDDLGKKASELLDENRNFLTQGRTHTQSVAQKVKTT